MGVGKVGTGWFHPGKTFQTELSEASGDHGFEARIRARNVRNHRRGDPADAAAEFAEINQLFAEAQHSAAGRPEIAARYSQERCFTGPVGAEDGPMLAAIYLPVDVSENVGALLAITDFLATDQLAHVLQAIATSSLRRQSPRTTGRRFAR